MTQARRTEYLGVNTEKNGQSATYFYDLLRKAKVLFVKILVEYRSNNIMQCCKVFKYDSGYG